MVSLAAENELFAKEIRGTGKENEIRGGNVSLSAMHAAYLSFVSEVSSENSYGSEGGVYELLAMSEGFCEFSAVALGDIYGDCNAETNADDDAGETRHGES